MNPRKFLPCNLCGRLVRHLGAVRWEGNDDPENGYLIGLHPVCTECMADPDVRFMANALTPESMN